MKGKFRVNVFKDEQWWPYSSHRNFEYAKINAELQARKHPSRIIHDGIIIWASKIK